ncbi:EamA family transporter [Mycobacterium sp. CBMA 234]|uniref:EamA family transporter n=1 Tax=Mycolicibacterium sp. CBMA 234 TaxID=1918495 RepID=UPI0012DE8C07|nr:EamA family transporter [Mycolicibacterium sp. CBMA 234]MUL64069.1 EamA family transporter [Mycolicibacterium sp. CBMA 234]
MPASNGTQQESHFRTGMIFAIASAFTFGMSGALGKSLIEAGWSPTAAVVARLAGGALVMAVVATILRRGWLREALDHKGTVIAYGVIPISGAQLCFYNSVTYLPVGVALLLEYASPLLVVGWVWTTTRRRPSNLTLAGVAIAVAGITLVLGLIGPGSTAGTQINPAGIGWGMGAAICAACYFVMSDKASADGTGLHSITLAAGGLTVGAVTVALLGASGLMPLTFTSHETTLAGVTMSWLVPVIAMAIIPTAMAYTFGIMGIARLQPRFASLVGLSEVMFAVLSAWALLGEAITGIQLLGGVVVLAGLALARQGDRGEATWHDDWPDSPEGLPAGQSIGRS